MSVNGIEIEVGQRWCTRGGREVIVARKYPPLPFVFKLQLPGDQVFYDSVDADGQADGPGMYHENDLVELVTGGPEIPAPDDHEALTFHPLDAALLTPEFVDIGDAMKGKPYGKNFASGALDESRSAGIGDINSHAKGSGARYNSGKPPYELIPLYLLATSLDRRIGVGNPARDAAIEALENLGLWQEHADADILYSVLLSLGMGGWSECARVFDYGRVKYAAWNWAKGMAWSIPMACAARHLLAIIEGETLDAESGLPHRGHVFCNIAMLLTYADTFPEGDDRPAAGLLAPVDAVEAES